jgi:serine/threonine-protein kinase
MTVGRRAIAAIFGLGALAAGAAALLAGPSADVRRAEAARAGHEALALAQEGARASAREIADEAATAAAVPQLRSALMDRVDTFTLDDLFKSEDWWAPHRARALVLTAPEGVVMSRNVAGGAPAAGELAARAAAARGASPPAGVARSGDALSLVASAPITVPDPPGRVLTLGLPVDAALVEAWAARAHAGLVLADAHGLAPAGGGPRPDALALAGHEGDEVVVDPSGAWAATSGELLPGLRAWAVHPLAAEAATAKLPLGALAGVLAVVALALLFTGRRTAPAPVTEAPSSPRLATVAPVASGTAVAPTLPATSAVPPGTGTLAGGPLRSGGNLPTMIASGEAQVFGRYTVLDKLGAGGMCDIYTAALTGPEGFQRTFVLKRLKPELALNRAAVDQFIDEAKLGSTLVHSNIVPVFDFGRVGDGYFIAQEYIVGRNVAQLCERHMERLGEPLDPATVFYVAHETLQALAYAHDKTSDDGTPLQIVHRDVSPGNIVVSRLGEVKLIDFGIVKAVSGSRVSQTDLGNVKGNAAFMSPEQARGLAVDRRSDLFSLGLVMYRALTGEPFYPGETTAEVYYGSATGPTPEHFARIDRLPAAAARVLKRALMPSPADRYATAEEFAAALVPLIPAGTKGAVATLINALFGAELKSGGSGTPGTGALRRDAS